MDDFKDMFKDMLKSVGVIWLGVAAINLVFLAVAVLVISLIVKAVFL